MLDKPENFQDSKATAIQKAFRVMQAIANADDTQPLAELAAQVAMPKPTVHRLLLQLEEVGAIRRDLTGKGYVIGAAWMKLAMDALIMRGRQPLIRGIMRKLVDQIQESCNLSVMHDTELLYLERVECDWPLRMQLHAGSRVPLHCTASGKLLMSQMNPKIRERFLAGLKLHKYTSNTITDRKLLEKEFEEIRKNNVAINKEEYHLGVIGVSVPVWRRDDVAVATLSIHAPSFRMSVETALSYVPQLQQSAREVAFEMGLNDLRPKSAKK